MQGKNLRYQDCDPTTRAGLDESRLKEWQKWKDFFAVKFVRGAELKTSLDEGNTMIPTPWIEVGKADHKRREGGPYVPPEFKSSLVACGNFEKTFI